MAATPPAATATTGICSPVDLNRKRSESSTSPTSIASFDDYYDLAPANATTSTPSIPASSTSTTTFSRLAEYLEVAVKLPKTDAWFSEEDANYNVEFLGRAVDIVMRDGQLQLRIVIIEEEGIYPIEEFDEVLLGYILPAIG